MQTILNYRRLRFGLLVLTGCLVCAMAGGCAERPNAGSEKAAGAAVKRFMFLANGDDPFWDALGAGLAEGAKQQGLEAKGLRAVLEKNNGTAQGQIEKLRQFASQSDIAGVAISVIQAENAAIVEEMKNLAAKGVKVITVDGDVNRATFRDARPYYIGTDNIAGGRLLGAAAKQLFASRGKSSGGYVQFAGFTDNDNARARMNGFKEAAGDAYREVDRMSDEMDLAKARDNVRSALVNHPDLIGLVGIWAYNAPAIAEVTEQQGVRDRHTIVTFDAQAAAIEHMAGGRIDAMVVQNPFEMGIQTVRLLTALHEGNEATVNEMFPRAGEPDGDLFTTGLRLIVPDTGTPLEAAAFTGDGVEVMSLSTFRDWLAKQGLSSS
ncbi:MAG: substrate-binding domain-containing protein [Planctomycetia bacterium]|jgi:ribose transport system substrate-binding protein